MNIQNRKENSYVFCYTYYSFIGGSMVLNASPNAVDHKNNIKFVVHLMDHFGNCKNAKKIWCFGYNQSDFTCCNVADIIFICYDVAKYDCTNYFY